jgi:hypothetical protein
MQVSHISIPITSDGARMDSDNKSGHYAILSLSQLFVEDSTGTAVHECLPGINFLELAEGRRVTVPRDVV